MSSGLTVIVDGQSVPLDDCGWIQRRLCGCIVAAVFAVVGDEWTLATAGQAHQHLNPTEQDRVAAELLGVTVHTTELLTIEDYRKIVWSGASWECQRHTAGQEASR